MSKRSQNAYPVGRKNTSSYNVPKTRSSYFESRFGGSSSTNKLNVRADSLSQILGLSNDSRKYGLKKIPEG